LTFARILYSEVVPLGKTLGAVVIFEIKIVFKLTDLHSFSKVSTLEAGLKNKGLICW